MFRLQYNLLANDPSEENILNIYKINKTLIKFVKKRTSNILYGGSNGERTPIDIIEDIDNRVNALIPDIERMINTVRDKETQPALTSIQHDISDIQELYRSLKSIDEMKINKLERQLEEVNKLLKTGTKDLRSLHKPSKRKGETSRVIETDNRSRLPRPGEGMSGMTMQDSEES